MMRKYGWPAIIVAVWLAGIALSRPPKGERPGTAPNDAGGGGTTGSHEETASSPGDATSAGVTRTTGGARESGGTTSVGGTATTGGSTASGGSSSGGGGAVRSSGDAAVYVRTLPSCVGLDATCGPLDESCCTTLPVPGGTFYRGYDGVDFTDTNYPATVAGFYLDKYEVTVGRFRTFVEAGMGTRSNPPASGTGAHPWIAGSGWDSRWNATLPRDTAGLKAAMRCPAIAYQTWTDTAGSNETMPQNCLDWYTAFAFCAWDGGRLPTEAEWNYAASGGSEHRYYPWSNPPSSTTIDDSYAVYCSGYCSIQNVGSRSPKGDGKWGQTDLAGNLWEWTLDRYVSPFLMPCNNCADLTVGGNQVARGGLGGGTSDIRSAFRGAAIPADIRGNVGVRCARASW